MKHTVKFIGLEEDEKDLVVSFAIDDPQMGVKSLILLRTPFFEEILDEEERGVKVSMEGDYFEQEDYNILKSFKISANEIVIKTPFRKYQLDISKIPRTEIEAMLSLPKKQNYDNKFTIQIA